MALLLCDLDNTLLDRTAVFRDWATNFASLHGQDESFVEWLIELDADGYGPKGDLFDAVRRRLNLAQSVAQLRAEYSKDYVSRFRCEEAVREALVRARREGWKIAIVTNGPPTQEDKIRHSGLDRLVDAWCVSDIEGSSKPDGELLRIAAQRCGGEDLADGWMIGDGPDTDIAAAADLAIASVWISRGRAWPMEHFQPTYEADSFPDAVRLILNSGNNGVDS